MSKNSNDASLLRRQTDMNRFALEHIQAQHQKRVAEALSYWREFFQEQDRIKKQNKLVIIGS